MVSPSKQGHDPDDQHDMAFVVDLVNDPIDALPDAIALETRQLFTTRRAGIICKGADPLQDPFTSCFGNARRSLATDFLNASS